MPSYYRKAWNRQDVLTPQTRLLTIFKTLFSWKDKTPPKKFRAKFDAPRWRLGGSAARSPTTRTKSLSRNRNRGRKSVGAKDRTTKTEKVEKVRPTVFRCREKIVSSCRGNSPNPKVTDSSQSRLPPKESASLVGAGIRSVARPTRLSRRPVIQVSQPNMSILVLPKSLLNP